MHSGRAKFPLIWVYYVRWCNSCKGPQVCTTGNFTFFWGVISFACNYVFDLEKYFCIWAHLWLQRDSETSLLCWREKLNSMNLLLYMAPIAVVLLLPATLYMEKNVVGITLALAKNDIRIIWYLLFNSALAYFVNLTNFLVTKHTSALTLQVWPCFWNAIYILVTELKKLWDICFQTKMIIGVPL